MFARRPEYIAEQASPVRCCRLIAPMQTRNDTPEMSDYEHAHHPAFLDLP